MAEVVLLSIAAIVFVYALVAKRLGEGIVTPPMVFLGTGLLLSFYSGNPSESIEETLHLLAEITLVIVLFSDAAMVKARMLSHNLAVPGRMLLIGLPLCIGFGFVLNYFVLPGWPVWELALLAAILAPTDAALGQAVVTNESVPASLRQSLTVESGVNDGLALPAVLFFGCLAVDGVHDNVQTSWVIFTLKQIGIGALIGIVIGTAGGWLIRFAMARNLTNDSFEGIGVLGLAALCYLMSVALEGNGFLAAFAGGLAFGTMLQGRSNFVFEFLETEGQLLVLGTFLLLGLAISPEMIGHVNPLWLALILASLFLVRPAAIWLSLLGTKTGPVEKIFMGWFGPRGLATALFALVVLSDFERLKHGEEILLISFLTVLISATLHGVTAAPGARWIGSRAQSSESNSIENKEAT